MASAAVDLSVLRWLLSRKLGVIQKTTGSGLEAVYKVSSRTSRPGRNDDEDVFDLDEWKYIYYLTSSFANLADHEIARSRNRGTKIWIKFGYTTYPWWFSINSCFHNPRGTCDIYRTSCERDGQVFKQWVDSHTYKSWMQVLNWLEAIWTIEAHPSGHRRRVGHGNLLLLHSWFRTNHQKAGS